MINRVIVFVAAILISLLAGGCGDQKTETCGSGYNDLLAGIEDFEAVSFDEFVRCRSGHDGHNLGDLYRASGLYLKQDPHTFFEILERYNVPAREVGNFVVMLPLDYVDMSEIKIRETIKRIHLVESTRNGKLRTRSIRVLKDRLVALQSQ